MFVEIERKLDAGVPLSMDDGLALYRTWDLHTLGRLARRQKERKSGKKVFYVLNRYINSTNVCFAGCTFCSFAADEFKEPRARLPHDAPIRCSPRRVETGTNFNQIHIVGGHDPRQLSLDYWLPLMRRFKQALAARAALAVHGRRDRVHGQAPPAIVPGDRRHAQGGRARQRQRRRGGDLRRRDALEDLPEQGVGARTGSRFTRSCIARASRATRRCCTGTSSRSRIASII